MGRYRRRAGIGAAAIVAFMTIHVRADHVRAEPVSTEPSADTLLSAGAESMPDSVSAQTISTSRLAKRSKRLFQHTSYPDAWTAAQKSNRLILLYISMPGCPHCDKMMKETYHFPNVEQMVSESFESFYVSRHTHPKLVKSLKVKWYPTTVLVGTNNKVVDVIEGYVDAKAFQRRLKVGLASVDSSTQTR